MNECILESLLSACQDYVSSEVIDFCCVGLYTNAVVRNTNSWYGTSCCTSTVSHYGKLEDLSYQTLYHLSCTCVSSIVKSSHVLLFQVLFSGPLMQQYQAGVFEIYKGKSCTVLCNCKFWATETISASATNPRKMLICPCLHLVLYCQSKLS